MNPHDRGWISVPQRRPAQGRNTGNAWRLVSSDILRPQPLVCLQPDRAAACCKRHAAGRNPTTWPLVGLGWFIPLLLALPFHFKGLLMPKRFAACPSPCLSVPCWRGHGRGPWKSHACRWPNTPPLCGRSGWKNRTPEPCRRSAVLVTTAKLKTKEGRKNWPGPAQWWSRSGRSLKMPLWTASSAATRAVGTHSLKFSDRPDAPASSARWRITALGSGSVREKVQCAQIAAPAVQAGRRSRPRPKAFQGGKARLGAIRLTLNPNLHPKPIRKPP